jgi:hypothetical protein
LELLGEESLELLGISWLLGKGAGTKNHTELRFTALDTGEALATGEAFKIREAFEIREALAAHEF